MGEFAQELAVPQPERPIKLLMRPRVVVYEQTGEHECISGGYRMVERAQAGRNRGEDASV